MSHVVTVQTQMRDPVAISAACQRLGLAAPLHGKAQLYAGQSAEGLLVQLPGWKYPVAIDTATGQVQHDNFQNHWGDIAELLKFQQAYAVEMVRLQVRKKGYIVSEQTLADGSVKLQIQEGS